MSRHAASKPRNRIASRTFWQALIPAVIGLGVILPEVIQVFLAEAGHVLPDNLRIWLLAAAGTIAAVSAGIAKVMAIPGVNSWLERIGLANDTLTPDTDLKGE